MSLKRELNLQAEKEHLFPKDEPQDVEQPQVKYQRVEETTHAEPSTRNGRKRTREADILMLDATEHTGAPTSQCRQRRSPNKYTRYMVLMS